MVFTFSASGILVVIISFALSSLVGFLLVFIPGLPASARQCYHGLAVLCIAEVMVYDDGVHNAASKCHVGHTLPVFTEFAPDYLRNPVNDCPNRPLDM